jgi:hypothetical protein
VRQLADAVVVGVQRWVARQLVRRQLPTRLAALIGAQSGERPLGAAGLSVELLNAGMRGGYAKDVAAQVTLKLHHEAPADGRGHTQWPCPDRCCDVS